MLPEFERIRLLEPPTGRVPVVIDTDTYNEIDDQFALVHALLTPERLDVQAIYAAPFHNERSSSPGDGMRRSLEEIIRVVDLLGGRTDVPILEGADRWLTDAAEPPDSPAARDLVERARAHDEPLYVIALAAPTTIASALLLEPSLADRLVVIWLGGQPTYWPDASEFNLRQDPRASRVLLDSGVPLVLVPCTNVTQQLRLTLAELERYVRGTGPVGAYLTKIFAAYRDDHVGRSKEIWDLGPGAWLIDPTWVPTTVTSSPILTDNLTWSVDGRRHAIREATTIDRDQIMVDLFRKLADCQ
jgi:purine nucleosidase